MPSEWVKCYGGPKDGCRAPFVGRELRVPRPIDYAAPMMTSDGFPTTGISVDMRVDVYRLVQDPIRGKAYIFDAPMGAEKGRGKP